MHTSQTLRVASSVVLLATFVAPAAGRQAGPPQPANPATSATAPPQAGQGRGRGATAPAVVSPEVSTDRRITFRINAPQAQAVRVSGGDIPGLGQNGLMTKGENGVWTFTSEPVPAGA